MFGLSDEEPIVDADAWGKAHEGGDPPPPGPPMPPPGAPATPPPVEVEDLPPPAHPGPADLPPPGAVPAGANQEWMRGRLFTDLMRDHHTVRVGLSLQCPTCGLHKDLRYVNSGMLDDVAINKLIYWADHCCPNHRGYGGRLLKDLPG